MHRPIPRPGQRGATPAVALTRMLARLQQAISASLLLLLLGWTLAMREAPLWVLLAGVLGLCSAHAIVLAFEFALMHRVNRTHAQARPRLGMLLRAWLHESAAAPTVFLWRQPWRSQRWPDRLQSASPGQAQQQRRGIVFVHGFVCNRGLWNPWLARLSNQQGRSFVAVNLEPVFGPIDDYVPIIDDAVHRITMATGTTPLLVCHSMGGLAARAWLRARQADARIAHVVTVGTPHQGTWLAGWSFVTNASQMRQDSAWLQQLRRDEPPERARLFSCYYSHCDNIVFPSAWALLPGARHRHVPGVPHVALATDPALMDEVLALLDQG